MIRPKALQKGDAIGIVAPASPPNQERLEKAIPFFTKLGFEVKLGNRLEKTYGYLAAKDEERLADFHEMIADDEVKAIVFACGGYGTGRIAGELDYDLIRSHPKIIWGYSDITYLHTAIRQKCGLITFHGPMPSSDIAEDDFDDLSASSFLQLFQPTERIYDESISPLQVLAEGEDEGLLVGGNLSLLVSTLGTPFEIETKGKILLIEDVHEEPYRVDSMLNQLKLAGKLDEACGVVIGSFTKAEPKRMPSLSLDEVFQHYLSSLSIPVMSGFKIGHCFPHFSVPLGAKATLNTKNKSLSVLPGVRED